MAVWGGRFQFQEASVTREDFGEPGEGLRDSIPSYPAGVFVGKFGEWRDESTTQADYQPKQSAPATFCAAGINFKLPQPLKREWWEDERFPIDELQPLYRASTQRYDDAARQADEHSGAYVGLVSKPQWPPEEPPQWQMPAPRRPYFHFNTLRMDGRFPRLTSTYTEELGNVTGAERPQVAVHAPGLLPWGVTQRETEYLKAYTGELMRHPQFKDAHDGGRHARVAAASSSSRWETSYEAACNQVLNAPSWLKDFLAQPYPKALR